MLNHHAAAACSPTRAMLLSGTDAHLGGLGVLIEYKNGERGAKRWSGKAGYEGYLNNDVATLPEILSDNGYFTAMSGKVSSFLRSILPLFPADASPSQVASGPARVTGALGTWLRNGFCHASRVLQSLRLGTSAGGLTPRWSTNSR